MEENNLKETSKWPILCNEYGKNFQVYEIDKKLFSPAEVKNPKKSLIDRLKFFK